MVDEVGTEYDENDKDAVKCPHCGLIGRLEMMNDDIGMHKRRVLCYCMECGGLCIMIYNFVQVIKLKEEIVK